jgi:hypothetical protein
MTLPVNVEKSNYLKAKMQKDGSTVTYGAVTISGTYTQAEVQALSTAVTNLIATLRTQGVIK